MITTTLTSSYHRKTLVHFCLQKKKPENAFLTLNSELLQNRAEKQIMSSKTTLNWLFNNL